VHKEVSATDRSVNVRGRCVEAARCYRRLHHGRGAGADGRV